MNQSAHNFPVLIVASCDKYAAFWRPFVDSFNEFFPGYSGKKFIISNDKDFDYGGFLALKVGEDAGWCENMIAALSKTKESHVLLFLEDVFLNSRPKVTSFENIMRLMRDKGYLYINLKAMPVADATDLTFIDGIGVGRVSKKGKYAYVLEPAIWSSQELIRVCSRSRDPWDAECRSWEIISDRDKYASVSEPVFSLDHLMIRGKLTREMRTKYCQASFDDIPVMGFWVDAYYKIRTFASAVWLRLLEQRTSLR